MLSERPAIEPIQTDFRVRFATDDQLNLLQDGTLRILEDVGVIFPSEKAIRIFSDHGAHVDKHTQVVKIPRHLVMKALSTVPRYFKLGARHPSCDLQLQDSVTYFCTDGCGVETIDFETRQRRPSCKDDVGKMAHIADYLSAISFYWPMVSAQDCGKTAPLHEMDASWNNTVKHVQSETIMGEKPCQYAVEMAKVISGNGDELRRRPVFSLTVCTIAPLKQDKEGIEGALVLAEAGVPVGFLAMPTLGTTAPATLPGAYVVGDAEIISAIVLMQLAYPGAPVFHSMMHAWADPRSGNYISYSLDSGGRYIVVDMAHHWKIPCLGGAYGTDSPMAGNWQSAAEASLDPFLIGLAGAEFVTGIGLSNTYTLLYPESIILDADIYHRARYQLMRQNISPEDLALDVIADIGPGGHFLGHRHTRVHMRRALKPSIVHEAGPDGKYRDPVEAARDKAAWILKNYQPEPLEDAQRKELRRILAAADHELDGG